MIVVESVGAPSYLCTAGSFGGDDLQVLRADGHPVYERSIKRPVTIVSPNKLDSPTAVITDGQLSAVPTSAAAFDVSAMLDFHAVF